MQNIGVVCDTAWDNYILINNKFKKISIEPLVAVCEINKSVKLFEGKGCLKDMSLFYVLFHLFSLRLKIYKESTVKMGTNMNAMPT